MQILLFDVDGVLIEPHGYHRALSETTGRLCELCGVADAALTENQIQAFEAAGISSEWDSSLICMILLVKQIWREQPDFTLPERLGRPAALRPNIHPDYDYLIQQLAVSALGGQSVEQRLLDLLPADDRLNPDQRGTIIRWIQQSRSPSSLPFLLFQEMIVGSTEFQRIYGLLPVLDTASFLQLYDIPLIQSEEAVALLGWSTQPEHAVAMFTARPGLARGFPWLSPDAELAAAQIGLTGIPSASVGSLAWLAETLPGSVDGQALVKPHPLHALLALLLALRNPLAEISEATRAYLRGEIHPALRQLQGAEITVFEDSPGGMLSLRSACTGLEALGVNVRPHYVGVGTHPAKTQTLRSTRAELVPDIHAGLRLCLIK